MEWTVRPSGPLRGVLEVPGDKSMSHRAALLAALADGRSVVDRYLVAGVTRVLLDALGALGVACSVDGDRLTVESSGLLRPGSGSRRIDCGHSATTLRLLAGALGGAGIPAVLDGSPGLRRRPMRRVVDPLRRMGVAIEASPQGTAPLVLQGRRSGERPRGGEHRLAVASGQVKSALLLAGLFADGLTTVEEPGPSRDHTERMLAAMGVRVDRDPGRHRAVLHPPSMPLPPLTARLPGDPSAAAFVVTAALITPGSEVRLDDVGLNPTRTGFLDVLADMGADLDVRPTGERRGEPVGTVIARGSELRAVDVRGDRIVRCIDELPVLAVAASFARGTTTVREAEELRRKETDRISRIATGLRALEIDVREVSDGLDVTGGRPAGGTVDASGDHRIAMALALAGLPGAGVVRVRGAEIASESYPGFADDLRRLGAAFEES